MQFLVSELLVVQELVSELKHLLRLLDAEYDVDSLHALPAQHSDLIDQDPFQLRLQPHLQVTQLHYLLLLREECVQQYPIACDQHFLQVEDPLPQVVGFVVDVLE